MNTLAKQLRDEQVRDETLIEDLLVAVLAAPVHDAQRVAGWEEGTKPLISRAMLRLGKPLVTETRETQAACLEKDRLDNPLARLEWVARRAQGAVGKPCFACFSCPCLVGCLMDAGKSGCNISRRSADPHLDAVG